MAELNHTRIIDSGASPERWLYLLHGIYGSGRNWGSLARRLVEERPEWGVVLVDLRLHGGSRDFDPPHTVAAAAEDVRRLEESLALPASVLLGHSFGGKVALVRAAPEGQALDQVWVADSTLRTGVPTGTAWDVVGIVNDLPDRFASRDDLADALEQHGYERGVGLWLAMNLERDGDAFVWRLDWQGIEEMLRDYFDTDVWSTVEMPPTGVELHFIRAKRSDSLDDASVKRIRAAGEETERVHLHEIDAGHWVNVDNPDAVLELLVEQLP